MTIFFTGDTHWGHSNIIKYCNRPFKHVDEMDEALITNWNSVVKPEDTIYHVGDVSFSKDSKPITNVMRRLNGHKNLVYGNHDNVGWLKPHFERVDNYREIVVTEPDGTRQSIVMFHYAMRVWNKSHYGAWHLYGHSHGTLPDDPNTLSIDVGVDCHNYTPISYDQIKAIMKRKNFEPVDKHGKK